ncbi:dUTP diphosphatase [Cytobacillus horneckiae]|uniref:dUTP diphosphatase n=1 Tax=Cytobacillus horneckiae TaxID=549687 RepID=UPI0034CFEA69
MKFANIFKRKKGRGFEPVKGYENEFGSIVRMPFRSTHKSAGYDISAIGSYVILPGMKGVINTGLTAYMKDNEWLALFVRSGLAYNNNLTLQNATGVIDSDFYGEHIRILLRNEGKEPFYVNHGDRIAQGVFLTYLKADEDTANIKEVRKDGFGSTGVKAA